MPQAGDVLGNYRIVRLLGSGGFADVFAAEDPLLQRLVALKILTPGINRTPDMLARFQREVRAVAALNHPGIVQIYSVGEAEGANYYAMRLLPGGDLRKRIGEGVEPRRALEIVRALASALEHAHQQGIIHRDIKPENILFGDDGLPVLTDFGIAKVLRAQEQLTAIGTAMGTPQYLSPEQARGGAVDARTDLYSLGVILFELLTRQAPYVGPDPLSIVLKHATEAIPRLPQTLAGLQPLIDQLMAKHPGQRPASAAETDQLIRKFLRLYPEAPPSAPPSAGASAAAPVSSHPAPAEVVAPASPVSPPAAGVGATAPEPEPEPEPRSPPTAAVTPPAAAPARRVTPALIGAMLAGGVAIVSATTWLLWPDAPGRVPETADAAIPPAAVAGAESAVETETRAQRIARERKRCALHVSSLTADGNLVYDDALGFPGARKEADGSGIRVPRIELANGQWVNALVTPEGCVLIRSLAAGPVSGVSE